MHNPQVVTEALREQRQGREQRPACLNVGSRSSPHPRDVLAHRLLGQHSVGDAGTTKVAPRLVEHTDRLVLDVEIGVVWSKA